MSYDNMEHADWVQRNIAAVQSRAAPLTKMQARRKAKHEGLEGAPAELLSWQRQAFDILGIVGGGIYNAPISWDRVEWSPRYLVIIWRGTLSTWDFRGLSSLVFACHTARIRCEVEAAARGYLRFVLSPRASIGGMSGRHPSLDEAITDWTGRFPPDHSIRFEQRLTAQAPTEDEA